MNALRNVALAAAVLAGFLHAGLAARAEGSDLRFDGPALSEEELGAHRGGQGVSPSSLIDMRAAVEGNMVHGATNGTNIIGQGAFSGASGFSSVIQNTGNNVLIQNATIVNLTME